MDEQLISVARQIIDKQINKIDRILDKRENSGQHFDDYLSEEKARLYGMLEIYWSLGADGYQQFKR